MSWLLPGTEMHTYICDNMVSQIFLPPSAVLHVYYHFHLQSLKEKKCFKNNMGKSQTSNNNGY